MGENKKRILGSSTGDVVATYADIDDLFRDIGFKLSTFIATGIKRLIVAAEWNAFRNLDMRAVKILLKQPIIIDGRNIYDTIEMSDIGFKYMGIGR